MTFSIVQTVVGNGEDGSPSKSNIWFINTGGPPESRRAEVHVIPLEDSGTFDVKQPKTREVENPRESSQLSFPLAATKCQVLVWSWGKEKKKKKAKRKQRSIIWIMFLSASQLLTPPNTTTTTTTLHSPFGSSSRPPGRNLLWFTTTHSTFYIHNPRLQQAHTHTRSPARLANWGKVGILLGWVSKWTSIEFPTVFLCDIVCPNIVHLEWKRGWSCMGNIISKATAAILAEYQCYSQILIPYSTIVWVWYQRTKVIAQGKVW